MLVQLEFFERTLTHSAKLGVFVREREREQGCLNLSLHLLLNSASDWVEGFWCTVIFSRRSGANFLRGFVYRGESGLFENLFVTYVPRAVQGSCHRSHVSFLYKFEIGRRGSLMLW